MSEPSFAEGVERRAATRKERENDRWWQAYCAILGPAASADESIFSRWSKIAADCADDALQEAKKRKRV